MKRVGSKHEGMEKAAAPTYKEGMVGVVSVFAPDPQVSADASAQPAKELEAQPARETGARQSPDADKSASNPRAEGLGVVALAPAEASDALAVQDVEGEEAEEEMQAMEEEQEEEPLAAVEFEIAAKQEALHKALQALQSAQTR